MADTPLDSLAPTWEYVPMHFIPTSVEGFRHKYGRTPTMAEMRACIDIARQPTGTTVKPRTNGCDCYDPECSICCDEDGHTRNDVFGI